MKTIGFRSKPPESLEKVETGFHSYFYGSVLVLVVSSIACSSTDDVEHAVGGGSGEGGMAGTAGSAGASGAAGSGGTGGSELHACPTLGITRCESLLVQTCEQGPDGRQWGSPMPCSEPLEVCRGDVCTPPSALQMEQIESLTEYAKALVNRSAWYEPLELDALVERGLHGLLAGDGDDDTYYRALRAVHAGCPQGHQSLYPVACYSGELPIFAASRFGVCGRPRGDGIVITYARKGNLLELAPGDRVESLEGMAGSEMFQEISSRLVCIHSQPSETGNRAAAAVSLFSALRPGEVVQVRSIDGTVKSVTIPSQGDAEMTNCQDPLGRDIQFDAESYIRPDEIAVIRLPRFFPLDSSSYDPNNPETFYALVDHMMSQVLEAFEPVKASPMIIWDVRSNYGGITPVGLAIVNGMPGAQATDLSYCRSRIPNSSPPKFSSLTYASYKIEPGGPFSYTGKVAVLMDELNYSAADYFPLAVRAAAPGVLLIGTPTAGAYGASGPFETLSGSPMVYFTIDVNRCSEAQTDEPLEGKSVQPHLHVEYDPQDLAEGIDTVMEAAVAALL